ncbi:MAG TPA: phosphoglycerate mutase family protein [Sphingomicrobium sp.]|nr:phosphoglycerate mutase family protein [Sphingomicrobium sp.]
MRVFGARLMMIAALLALGGCASAPPPAAQPDIYVMRHLHTPAGVTDPDLTDEGQRVALALVTWFKRDRPKVIYVSSTKRAQQTAAPLARKLGVAPTIYNPADTAGLIAAVSRETRTVLVVGHSNTVPDIIERLGGQRPAPLVHEDFGDIWRISGPTRVTERSKIAG